MTEDHDVDPIDAEHADPDADCVACSSTTSCCRSTICSRSTTPTCTASSSFVTNFGSWKLPAEVATALAAGNGAGAVEWIHDTGELVLLGGTPTEGELSAVPRWLFRRRGGVHASVPGRRSRRDATGIGAGMVREYFKADVLPPGSRVAVLAHIAHGPAVHELLWGWHREHGTEDGWTWLVERLARLENADRRLDHLG